MFKKKLDRFCILCGDWTGRKYWEISQKIGKNTDKYKNIGDIFEKLSKYPSTDNRWRISCRIRPISDISPKYRRNFSTFQSLVVSSMHIARTAKWWCICVLNPKLVVQTHELQPKIWHFELILPNKNIHERACIPAQLGYPDWIRLQLMVELANPKHWFFYLNIRILFISYELWNYSFK